jgi:hypothetical protein
MRFLAFALLGCQLALPTVISHKKPPDLGILESANVLSNC